MEQREMISLNKKSWHYKLQKFILRNAMPQMFNFCPYFWLTIFCIIVSPIMLPIRFLEWMLDCLDTYILEPRFEKWVETIGDETAYKLYRGNKVYKPTRLFENKKNKDFAFYVWMKKKNFDWDKANEYFDKVRKKLDTNFIEENKIKEENRRKKEEKEEKRKAFMKKFTFNYPTIIKWTKKFVGLVISLLCFIILFFLIGYTGKGIYYIIDNWNWDYVIVFAVIIGFIAGVTLIVFIINIYSNYIIRRYQENKHVPWYANLLYKAICLPIYYIIIKPLVWIAVISWDFIIEIYNIFSEYFGAAYGDYCPGIKWNDED